MKKYLYARISSPKQNIERQIRNLRAVYPDGILVQEAYTGTKMDRKEWNRIFQRVQAGDLIAFDSVSRMSRNAEEGIEAYEELYNRGVSLVFLKEPHINTATYKNALANAVPLTGTSIDLILQGVNNFLLELAREQIRLAFEQSEKEVSDLHQRTREGIETARLSGKQIGRAQGARLITKKSVAAKELLKKHCKEFGGSLSDAETMALAGLSRNTFYKYKRELREETGAD